jgi:predicted TPR repeat methyltransferase
VKTYKRIVALNPNDSSAQFELAQTSEQANDIPSAIAAYERFVKLAPEDPTTPAVKDRIKQLKASQTANKPAASG